MVNKKQYSSVEMIILAVDSIKNELVVMDRKQLKDNFNQLKDILIEKGVIESDDQKDVVIKELKDQLAECREMLTAMVKSNEE